MFRNYLAAALRNLARNRLYAAINIIGLAVGFAAALLIGLYVRDELSYDKWIPDHKNVYLLTETLQIGDRSSIESQQTPIEFAEFLRLDFPQMEAIARLAPTSASLRHASMEANETVYWADPELFDVLPLPVVAGDLKAALHTPDGIVLSESMARKYFGDGDPLGASIEVSRMAVFRVMAIIKDLPSNTHLDAQIFASGLSDQSHFNLRKGRTYPAASWDDEEFTYIKLAPGVAGSIIERDLPLFLQRHKQAALDRLRSARLWMTPISDVHLRPHGAAQSMKPTIEPAVLYALAATGLLILVVASINFVNLTTARAARRVIEVGVRKVTGARRRDLIVQFLGESILYAIFAGVAATEMARLVLPSLNSFLGHALAFQFNFDTFGAAALSAVGFVGVLAGFYPALVLSGFRPVAVLKGPIQQGAESGRLRQALVVVQFAILIGLVIAVATIYRQTYFALNEGLRQDKDQVLLVESDCKGVFKQRLQTLPGVRAVACSLRSGLEPDTSNASMVPEGRSPVITAFFQFDLNYLELYGFHPVAGRFFDSEHTTDLMSFDPKAENGPSIVINETAVRAFGFSSPLEAIGRKVKLEIPPEKTGPALEIIGVAPDFSLDSIHSLVPPSFYTGFGQNFRWISIKLTGRDVPETLTAIDKLWQEAGEPRPIRRLFLDQAVETLYIDITRQSQLFAAFTIVAILISCLGLFGLAAFTAEQRTKEIGVRKAMGASQRDIVRLLLWQFTRPLLWSNIIAWPVAFFIMRRWLEGFAYHTDLSPWMFLGASALAVVIAMFTVIGHAILVARAQPVTALRYE